MLFTSHSNFVTNLYFWYIPSRLASVILWLWRFILILPVHADLLLYIILFRGLISHFFNFLIKLILWNNECNRPSWLQAKARSQKIKVFKIHQETFLSSQVAITKLLWEFSKSNTSHEKKCVVLKPKWKFYCKFRSGFFG